MKFIYYKAKKGNFGDDLNPWLWEKLFGKEDVSDGLDLVGIGSILFDGNKIFSKDRKKIVFGSGIRPNSNSFNPDPTWKILFLRGPLSARSMNNDYPYITDSAYSIRQARIFKDIVREKKKYEISFMPHYQSLGLIDWEDLCNKLNIHYISCKSESGIEFTLREIARSKSIITESMHGAILADAFRVPWHRLILSTPYTEGSLISEFKWKDWLLTINKVDFQTTGVKLYEKYLLGKIINKLTFGRVNAEFFSKSPIHRSLLSALSKINAYSLSDERTITKLDNLLKKEIKKVGDIQKTNKTRGL
ncbi:polysaccharide pyruvyl transferase family protein [Leptospira sarikeiensis]|uniref:Polysaccharide pyruvyl transferase n=1 Tax=Leptospira sarikeiensis TaxID=2484943 RepID=A0A4R9K7P4_9LEPT|nr:polysaccharide pyruvyl transferase family protein [Leptospira sarikeiensis]TGL61456.1 polysaccharide pyruvyl transferase [Leptospira sarikeiensis]